MNIVLPDEIERRISPAAAQLNLAIGLFSSEEITLGQAAAIAGLSTPAFQQELGKRRISLHYGADELAQDIAAVAHMTGGDRNDKAATAMASPNEGTREGR